MRWRNLLRQTLDNLVNDDYLLDDQAKRWKTNLTFLNGFVFLMSLVVLPVYLARGFTLTIIGDLCVMGVCVLSVALLYGMRRHEWALYVLALGMMLYAFFLLLFGASEVYVSMWVLMYPLCVCFFLGNTFARPYLTLLLAAILFMLSPVFDGVRTAWYSAEFCTQFPIIFVVFSLLAMAAEYIRRRTGQKLMLMARHFYESANQDQLTGLYNRRAFYDIITREQARDRRHQGGLQLILCDIDHFKVINDRFGHQAGDRYLKHIAHLFKTQLRGEDYCFRWGGEEFLLVLPNTSPEGGLLVAQRLRDAVENAPLYDGLSGEIATTMSFGVQAVDNALSVDDNIALTDACLYAAKKNGRNRVEQRATSV